MNNKPNAKLLTFFAKCSLRKQLILLIIIVFTFLGVFLFLSLSRITHSSIFQTSPMVEIEPTQVLDQNIGSKPPSNPDIPADIGTVQSLALLQLQTKLQKVLAYILAGALGVSLFLAIWLSKFISNPIIDLTEEITQSKNNSPVLEDSLMPSQELTDLHAAIVSNLDRFEKEIDDQNQFLLDVAHEFRTPIASLRMKIDVDSKKNNISSEDFFSLCQSIDHSTSRLEQLLGKLNALSNFGNNVRITAVNLSKIVNDVIEILIPIASDQLVQVENKVNSDLIIRTDLLFVQTILLNLVENAIKYNKKFGKVTISGHLFEGACEMHVTDTGIGIESNEIGKVFNRFYRVDKSRSRKTGGSGLGLSIVKTLLEKLGGRISLKSSIGAGTEVIFLIPDNQESSYVEQKEKHE